MQPTNEILNLQRNIFDIDNMTAYAWRVKKYFARPTYSALDIGCGLGFHTEQIAKLCNHVHFTMIDVDGVDQPVNFSPAGYAHNSIQEAKARCNFNCEVMLVDDYAWQNSIDVVISTLSWGWHYPLSLYMDRVLQLQPVYIIVDQRDIRDTIPGYDKIDSFTINRKETTIVYAKSLS